MKEIRMITINKIKSLDLKIFEYEDDEPEYVNRRGVANCYNAIWYRVLKEYTVEEKRELLEIIRWSNDDCKSKLERAGWSVILK